jgi:hypothetical protein
MRLAKEPRVVIGVLTSLGGRQLQLVSTQPIKVHGDEAKLRWAQGFLQMMLHDPGPGVAALVER